MIWSSWVAWANLDKILTPGFYSYMKNPDNFISAPALTGNAYEDMRYALESNNVCTGWKPQHRIQFAHSKGDMVVPYGNYLAFHNAHPHGLDDNSIQELTIFCKSRGDSTVSTATFDGNYYPMSFYFSFKSDHLSELQEIGAVGEFQISDFSISVMKI